MRKTEINLVPNIENKTPDYYCTWQTQLFATSNGRPPMQRKTICEKSLFDREKPYGWAYFHEKAQRDLLLIMDDSWDVPMDGNTNYYGSLILNEEKFSSFTEGKTNAEALGALTKKVKDLGWKGLGGWVCAQESAFCDESPEKYWKKRLIEADEAGFAYWKVDWGKKDNDKEFRKMMTSLAEKYAPNLIIEHSFRKDVIPFSHIFRTYDVPAIMSIPMTMEKLAEYSNVPAPEKEGFGLIDCEDEAYIAAAGGFAMGIMRHPYVGVLPNGKADPSFPEFHRNIKSKQYEVIRAARFHRIAPAFPISSESTNISDLKLDDTWQFVNKEEEIEGWWLVHMGSIFRHISEDDLLTKTAPAAISRGCELPKVEPDEKGNIPYCMASKNPSGAYAIATLGRTLERDYFIPKCHITAQIEDAETVGIFGEYASLTLAANYSDATCVLMQDLAAESAYDITDEVEIKENKIVIPGELISRLGRSEQGEDDTSEPGVLVRIVRK